MDTVNTLNNILNQSFQDELNRHNNRPINTSENVNVSNLFTKLQGVKTDCNICYNETKCLQCYQCQFNYCEECMTKVISEYNKCSACQANFINSYNKLEQKNADTIKNNNNSNNNNSKNNNSNNQIDYSNFILNDYVFDDYVFDDYDTDNEIEQITIAIKNSLNDINDSGNNNGNNNGNNSGNNNANNNSGKTTLEIYIEELQNNEILPYKITSLKNNNFTPNFTAFYNINKKLLIYCPHDKKLPNIELNYKIFNTQFQLELRIILIHILTFSNKFNNTWIKIRNAINSFTNINKNIMNKKITDKNKINDLLTELKSLSQ
jgi:hypothetical protein